jgi:hypothetical protein
MTATPEREDGLDIRELFGNEVVNIPLAEGIANDWLTKVRYRLITDNINKSVLERLAREVLEEGRKVSLEQINRTLFIRMKDEKVAKIILDSGRKGIVFCKNIEHAEYFSRYLPGSVTCHCGKSNTENDQALVRFRQGLIRFLLVVDKFDEGVDLPDTELLVFLRSTESERIFLQQLGRGLRIADGKYEVLVLDFAGNCERVIMVKELVDRIVSFYPGIDLDNEPIHLSGKGFDFLFDVKEFDILPILERLSHKLEFYATWQEASKAVVVLGEIRNREEYYRRYKEDPRLPSDPSYCYDDFPGWKEFLGRYYHTCLEAMRAVRKIGIRSRKEYWNRCKEDSRLVFNPQNHYQDFPGWKIFLGRYYASCVDAMDAVKALGIKSRKEYKRRYKEDGMLPHNPGAIYPDFPGWLMFLGANDKYGTCREASRAAIEISIKTQREYYRRYSEDARLPSHPRDYYQDFPGWLKFLGKEEWPEEW